MRDCARGRAATRRSMSARRATARSLRPSANAASAASTIALGTKRGAMWRRRTISLPTATAEASSARSIGSALSGSASRRATPRPSHVARLTRRGPFRQASEVSERQREQPLGADGRRQRRDNEHGDYAERDAGKNGDCAIPEPRPIVSHAVCDVEHRQEIDRRRKEEHRLPPPSIQKPQRHQHKSEGQAERGKGDDLRQEPERHDSGQDRAQSASVEKQERCGISRISRRRQQDDDHGAERDRRDAIRPGAHDPEQRDRPDREEDAHGVDKRRHPVGDVHPRGSPDADNVAGIDHARQAIESARHAEHAGGRVIRQQPLHRRLTHQSASATARPNSTRRATPPVRRWNPLPLAKAARAGVGREWRWPPRGSPHRH